MGDGEEGAKRVCLTDNQATGNAALQFELCSFPTNQERRGETCRLQENNARLSERKSKSKIGISSSAGVFFGGGGGGKGS